MLSDILIGTDPLLNSNGDFSFGSLRTIHHRALYGVTKIKKVIFPAAGFHLGTSSFSGLPDLTTVEFGQIYDDSVVTGHPFTGDAKLTNLIIPRTSAYPSHLDFKLLFGGTPLEAYDWRDFLDNAPPPTSSSSQSNNGGNGENNVNSSGNEQTSGLSGGAVAGIVIAVIVVVALLAVGGFFLYKKKSTAGSEWNDVTASLITSPPT